jgi:hypothetical protein
MPIRVIAKNFKVSESTVRAILRERPEREESNYEVATIQAEANKIQNLLRLYEQENDYKHLSGIRYVAIEMAKFVEDFTKKAHLLRKLTSPVTIPSTAASSSNSEISNQDDKPKRRDFRNYDKKRS